jgi:hypothetical protein
MWYRCDECLPDEFEKVLTYEESTGVCEVDYLIASRYEGGFVWANSFDPFKVTHWCFLPDLPKPANKANSVSKAPFIESSLGDWGRSCFEAVKRFVSL